MAFPSSEQRAATAPLARQPRPLAAAHWLSALALLAVFALVLGRELMDEKAVRATWLQLHRVMGLLVWALALTRLLMRSRWRLQNVLSDQPRWQAWLASGIHGLLYVFLLGLPLLGWALTNAAGKPVVLPLLGTLPTLLAPDPDLADALEEWHGTLAWVLAALVGAHAAAALWHHLVLRDGVLRAMWPWTRTGA